MTRSMKWLAATLLGVAVFVGCGSIPMLPIPDSGSGGGGGSSGGSCSSDTNCASGQLCHPVLKQCIPGCTKGADCSTGICKRFDGTAGSTYAVGFCQCTADSQCGSQICQQVTLQCEAPCTSTSCPTGYACNNTTGQCGVPMDAGTDAGTDAGVTDAGVACDTSHAQPDTCGYGNACATSMTCQAAENDTTCAGIAGAVGKGNYSLWNPTTGTGPVIYVVQKIADNASQCQPNQQAFTVTVYAYAGTSLFPQTKTGLPGFWFFDPQGNKTDIVNDLLPSSGYTVATDGKTMSATFSLCPVAGTTTLNAAFAFTGGNAYCATLMH